VSDVEERHWVVKKVSERIQFSERSVYKRKQLMHFLFWCYFLGEVKTITSRNCYIISLFP
jgi:hypothetical protein